MRKLLLLSIILEHEVLNKNTEHEENLEEYSRS